MNQRKGGDGCRNHFIINLHESMGPERNLTCNPWICSLLLPIVLCGPVHYSCNLNTIGIQMGFGRKSASKPSRKIFLMTDPRRYFFVGHWLYLCLVVFMLSRLFIAALWSPGKLTSWLLFVMFIVILLLSHLLSWSRCCISIPDPCYLSNFQLHYSVSHIQ